MTDIIIPSRRSFLKASAAAALGLGTQSGPNMISVKFNTRDLDQKRVVHLPEPAGYPGVGYSVNNLFFKDSHAYQWALEGPKLGVSLSIFDRHVNQLYIRLMTSDFDIAQGASVKFISRNISRAHRSYLDTTSLTLTKLAHDWLLAEAICAVVRTRIALFTEIQGDGINRRPFEDSNVVLSQAPPKALCGGFANLTRDIARECGLSAFSVPGQTRQFGEVGVRRLNNHAWTVFVLEKGCVVPADTSASHKSPTEILRLKGKDCREILLPKTPLEWELNLAGRRAYDTEDRDMNPAKFFDLTDQSFEAWSVARNGDLLKVKNDFRRAEWRWNSGS